METTVIILWVYIALLIAGGLMGFIKAKSKASISASTVFVETNQASTHSWISSTERGFQSQSGGIAVRSESAEAPPEDSSY